MQFCDVMRFDEAVMVARRRSNCMLTLCQSVRTAPVELEESGGITKYRLLSGKVQRLESITVVFIHGIERKQAPATR